MSARDWEEHYRSGQPPWETGGPSSELERVIRERGIAPGRVLELGCGSGINAVWLAERGFDVTAIDFVPLAIERARQRAGVGATNPRFVLADVLDPPESLGKFPFVFDRGCYHSVRDPDAGRYVNTLLGVTSPAALCLILAGNSRSTHQPGQGPPVVSEAELRADFEPAFRIVSLREFQFDHDPDLPIPKFLGWSCLLERASE